MVIEDLERKVVHVETLTRRVLQIDHRPFDDMSQLANVARPRTRLDGLTGPCRQPLRRAPDARRGVANEHSGQWEDIGTAVSERGHDDREHPESMIQVAAQQAVSHGLLRIGPGRGHQTGLQLDRDQRTDPFDPFRLDEP